MKPIGWVLLIILFSTCSKEKIELNYVEIDIPTIEDVEDVVFTNADTGYIVGGNRYVNGLLLTTIDGGTTWQVDTIGEVAIYDIDIISENLIYAIGHYGYFYQSYDKGATWNVLSLPDMEFYWNIDFYSSSHGVATGGGAFRSGGIHVWEVNQEPRNAFISDTLHSINDAVMLDAETIIAVGFGIVKRSTDGGLSFQTVNINGDNFNAVHFPSSQIGYAVGTSGAIIKTYDRGEHWETIKSPNNFTQAQVKFKDVYFTDENTGYIVGWNGTFWKTENGGEDWIVANNLPDVDFTSISIKNGKGYLTAKGGRFFEFTP